MHLVIQYKTILIVLVQREMWFLARMVHVGALFDRLIVDEQDNEVRVPSLNLVFEWD